MDEANQKVGWKQKAIREFIRYWINVAYLSTVFGLFAWYRRLILAHYDIKYFEYGIAIIEALIMAKVIMIGDAVGLGNRIFKDKPLIYPTLYKSVVFTCFVGVFAALEGTIKGWFKGDGLAGWLIELHNEGRHEFLARCLIVFVVFIPFFGFKELGKVFGGEGRLGKLFFRSRQALPQ
jgi:hypothetical protein